jgi:hypothetical protein
MDTARYCKGMDGIVLIYARRYEGLYVKYKYIE